MTDILHCGRTMAGDYVAFAIRWSGALPAGDEVLWSMLITADDGAETLQLTHERRGGTETQYVLDRTTGHRQDVAADADLRDDEITVRFPANVVGVASEWPVWKAVITVDGQDVSSKLVPLAGAA